MEISRNPFKTFQMESTRQAITDLKNLLRCSLCNQEAMDPIAMGRCDHFFCGKCLPKLKSNTCSECKIVTPASEMKPDIIVSHLLSCSEDLLSLMDGNKIDMTPSYLEAGFGINQLKSSEAQSEKVAENSSKSSAIPTNNSLKSTTVRKSYVKLPKIQPVTPKPDPKLIPDSKTPKTPMLNKRNNKGETPLHSACVKGDVSLVIRLLNEGANPNTKDHAGWTPLHEASSNGYVAVVELLLKHGAIIDVPGIGNETPLHDAVTNGCTSIVELLVKWGADKTAYNERGQTPCQIAELSANQVILNALETKVDRSLAEKSKCPVLSQKMLVLDANLSPDYKKKASQFSKMFKIKVVSDYSPEVTHVVTMCKESRVCESTWQYVCGLVSGKWILSHEWLDACIRLEDIAEGQQYEITKSTSFEDSGATMLSRQNSSLLKPGLFKGLHIYFQGSFLQGPFSKKELELIVKAGDGICLQREPDPEGIDANDRTVPYHYHHPGPLTKCSHYCVYEEGIHEPLLKYDMPHLKSLKLKWLLDCISKFRIVDVL